MVKQTIQDKVCFIPEPVLKIQLFFAFSVYRAMISSFQILSILYLKFILLPFFPLMSSYTSLLQTIFVFSLDSHSSHLTYFPSLFSLADIMNSFYLSLLH